MEMLYVKQSMSWVVVAAEMLRSTPQGFRHCVGIGKFPVIMCWLYKKP